jgi:hypothetical protein
VSRIVGFLYTYDRHNVQMDSSVAGSNADFIGFLGVCSTCDGAFHNAETLPDSIWPSVVDII